MNEGTESGRRFNQLRQRLDRLASRGLADDAWQHAEQYGQIAGILSDAFGEVDLEITVVGGSAIELHAPGVYTSGDIDLVIEPVENVRTDPRVRDVFESLGFERKGRVWVRGDLVVDPVSSHLEGPSEVVRVGSAVFRIVRKEFVLVERIVWYCHHREIPFGQQAIDMLAAFGDDLDMGWLRPELERQHSWDAFVELRALATSREPVTRTVLEALYEKLGSPQGRPIDEREES